MNVSGTSSDMEENGPCLLRPNASSGLVATDPEELRYDGPYRHEPRSDDVRHGPLSARAIVSRDNY